MNVMMNEFQTHGSLLDFFFKKEVRDVLGGKDNSGGNPFKKATQLTIKRE